jgi:[ribosomal protein S5]-alanine N-acetyltransferase
VTTEDALNKGNPFLAGSQVYLRALERADLNETYLAWLNDPEVTRYLETGVFPSTLEDLEKFYETVTGSRSQVILAIVDKKSDRHIGNVKLGPIDWIHRRAVFGILIGEKKFWGRGIGEEVTRLMVEYAFQRLNLNRVTLGVTAEHQPAVRCYEKVGFRVEGRIREDLFKDGEYKDRLWMGLLRSEYLAAQKKGKRK